MSPTQTVALDRGPTVARPWPCVLDISGARGVARPFRGHAPQSADRGPFSKGHGHTVSAR